MEPIYVILTAFLLLNLGVGLYYGRNVRTFKEYVLGKGSISTLVLASTIAATWTTGSGFNFYITDAYEGALMFFSFVFSVLALWLVGRLAIRMGEFFQNLSLAESIGTIYGKEARFITALSGILLYFGWIALQFKVISQIFALVFKLNYAQATLIVGSITILYATFGGFSSILFTDLLQISIFLIGLPILILAIWWHLPQDAQIGTTLQTTGETLVRNFQSPTAFNFMWSDCIHVLFISLQPALFQRVLAARNTQKARRAFNYAAILWGITGLSYLLIGLLLKTSHPNVIKQPENDALFLLKYILQTYQHPILVGMLLIMIMSMVMSSNDSNMNGASLLFTNDIAASLGLPAKSRLLTGRLFTLILGTSSLIFSFLNYNLWWVLKFFSMFYTSTAIMPLFLATLGFRTTKRCALAAMGTGVFSSIFWQAFAVERTEIDSSVLGMLVNLAVLFASHYLLKEPGGWVGIKDKAPLLADRQMRRQRWYRLRASVQKFNLSAYLQKNLPLQERTYLLVGIYILTFVFGSCFFLPAFVGQHTFASFVLISALALNSITMLYPIWPDEIKGKHLIAPLWCFTIGYTFFYASSLLVFLSGFHVVHMILFASNLILVALLVRWQLATSLFGLGLVLSLASYRYVGFSLALTHAALTPAGLFFACAMMVSTLLAILHSKKQKLKLEHRQLTLSELQRSAEDTLYRMKAAPDYFVRQINQTNKAGIQSAYALSKGLQARLQKTKVPKEIVQEAIQLTQQIEKSASYLEKTIYAIENQTQLQKKTIYLAEFLDKLYDRLPDIEEGALLLSNQSQAKTIQCDVHKIHGLLQKTYAQIRLQHPEQDYFYLHVQDTTLRYPNHKKPIPALAFLFTQVTDTTPRIASSYTHLDKMPIDPHAVGSPYFQEAQMHVDKHYGYLGLANIPNEYLMVLPVRLDDIRPHIIEDEAAPSKALDSEFIREAKAIELDFWNAIVKKKHYDLIEIERVVDFMKATHQHQTRKSGHPYYTHTLSVAKYASEHSEESYIIIAALLHDIVEDTGITLEEIGVRFGPKVEKLVRLLSNIKGTFKKYTLDSKKEHVALLSEEKEAILIKACDRLHNLQTLDAMPRHKQKAKAKETLEYYTPVIRTAEFAKLAQQLEKIAKKFL